MRQHTIIGGFFMARSTYILIPFKHSNAAAGVDE